MLKCRTIQLLAGIAAFAATLASPSPSQAAEVGYDLKSNKFSGTIPHGDPFQITLWTKPGGSATLTYWPFFESNDCTENTKAPTHATTFAARSLEIKDGNQKLAFDLPKLLPDQDYCFKLTVTQERSLDDAEKFRISTAVQRSLDRLAAGPLIVGEFSPKCQTKFSSASQPASTPLCAVAELFEKHLTLDLLVLRVNDPKAVKRSLPEVFQEALSADTDLLDALNGVYNQKLRHDTLTMDLETARRHMSELRALLLRLAPGEPVYSPPESKPKKASKGQPSKPALPAISVVPRSALDRLRAVDDLLSKGKFVDAQTVFAKEFESILKLSCAEELPSEMLRIPDSPPGLAETIDGLWRNTCDISGGLDKIISESFKPEDLVKPSFSAITSSNAFVRLFNSLTAVTIVESEATSATSVGPREKSFPFYASVDVGVAPIIFSGSTVNLAQYFALNMYFTAVDPDEPLWKWSPGRNRRANFLRRLSVSVGVTTTGRQIENARNVSGIIGSQLLMAGLGLRLTRLVRLSGGVVLFNQEDPNPVVDKRHLRTAPYIALSLDVALFNWAKNLAN